MRCLNCGNKAKKDCLYYRCRSCCRGHGFLCQTHVKSTWVPISTRQAVRNPTAATMMASSAAPPQEDHRQQDEQQQSRLPSSSGCGEPFPSEVRGEATFTCVRVAGTSEENAYIDQYAYETAINIGGHVFKGILYEQGPQQLMMNTHDINVDDGDQQGPTVIIRSNLQSVNNPRPSSSSTPPS